MSTVTLLSDFGTADGYAAEMKGVLVSGGAGRLVDVTHRIRPGDVRAGAWVLHRIWARFPPDSVHLAVVDPGVGSERPAVAARAGERWFVGPDNGLITWVARRFRVEICVELDPGRVGIVPVSDTFHGRDLFAPAAARIAAGSRAEELGPSFSPSDLVRLPIPEARRDGNAIRGQVWHVDRFGNLITNVPVEWLPERPQVWVGDGSVRGLRRAYAEVEPGEPLLTRGSMGTLEISVRGGSAADRFGAGRGEGVEVVPAGEGGEG